jgi:hypothetical protein
MKHEALRWVDTAGGPFVLLPLTEKRSWTAWTESGSREGDLGIVRVGEGQALLMRRRGPTTFLASDDGGVLVQRAFRKEDTFVREAVAAVLAPGRGMWQPSGARLDVGKGRLTLFDASLTHKNTPREQVLEVRLPRGVDTLEAMTYETELFEAALVRLRQT